MNTITEQDILVTNAVTTNVSTFDALAQLREWGSRRNVQPVHVEYLISEQSIIVADRSQTDPDQPVESAVSPPWVGRVKNRVKELKQLPANWDSYGAVQVDPRIPPLAERLIEWFAVAGMPPPDVFATSDGGIQLEWHIRRV